MLLLNMKQNESDNLSVVWEGPLQKYTNVMKGWCPRWFRLDPISGTFDYYLQRNEVHKAPRGSLDVRGAIISPSEEDSHTFIISSTSSEAFKLRASDAKHRQQWIHRLRTVSEISQNPLDSSIGSVKVPNRFGPIRSTPWDSYSSTVFLPAVNPTKTVHDWATAHSEADNQLRLIGDILDRISKETDQLPTTGGRTAHDRGLMELSGTSLMTLHTLQDAIRLLENEAYCKPKHPD